MAPLSKEPVYPLNRYLSGGFGGIDFMEENIPLIYCVLIALRHLYSLMIPSLSVLL